MKHGGAAARPGALRRCLDALYDGCAGLAALFMIALLVMVLLSILGRQLHFNVPGVDAYAGYMMAATGFLALAHTLRRGEHIRVTLLIGRLTGSSRRAFEIWSLFAATLLAALFAAYSIRLAWQSHRFHDVSTANDATPLWIPQLGMAIGTSILFVAMVDALVAEWQGRREHAAPGEALHNE